MRFQKPAKASRGPDSVIPEAVYLKCLRETSGDFHQLIRFLWATGCRPGEAARLTVESADLPNGCCRLRTHKTARRTGRQRVIYLSDDAAAVVREQAEKYRAGLLFRGGRGGMFTLQAYTMRFERLSEKVGHAVRSYDFRHSWASRALAQGVPDAHVAALLGHTGTQMLHKHYSHITSDSRLLRDVAKRVA